MAKTLVATDNIVNEHTSAETGGDSWLIKYAALSGRYARLERAREQAERPIDKAHISNKLRGLNTKMTRIEEEHPDIF